MASSQPTFGRRASPAAPLAATPAVAPSKARSAGPPPPAKPDNRREDPDAPPSMDEELRAWNADRRRRMLDAMGVWPYLAVVCLLGALTAWISLPDPDGWTPTLCSVGVGCLARGYHRYRKALQRGD